MDDGDFARACSLMEEHLRIPVESIGENEGARGDQRCPKGAEYLADDNWKVPFPRVGQVRQKGEFTVDAEIVGSAGKTLIITVSNLEDGTTWLISDFSDPVPGSPF